MKKLYFLATAAVLSLASCSDESHEGGVDIAPAMSFTASYHEDGTRATLNGNNETFDAGDAISILSSKNSNKRFVTTNGGTTVTFTGSAEEDKNIYAIYPYQEGLSFWLINNGTKISGASIPSTQWNNCWSEGGKSGWDPSAPLAYAVATADHTLHFRNLCAILKVTIPEINDNVTITVGASQSLSGSCEIINGALSVIAKHGSNTVKIGDETKKVKGGSQVYVAIAPGTYSDFYVSAENGINETRRSKNHAVFEANKIYDLGEFAVDIHESVDLGLPSGTRWATCNVGASKPEDYGDYFAWGETAPKTVTYNWTYYKFGTDKNLTKYTTSDGKTVLELEDDAAYANWGGDWRMPTAEQVAELSNNRYCTWEWVEQNGVKGYKVVSKQNDNSIFLPAAGRKVAYGLDGTTSYGYYWSTSLRTDYVIQSKYMHYYNDTRGLYHGTLTSGRGDGHSVRPVLPRQN